VERGFHPEKASLDCEDDLIGGQTCRIFKAGLDVLRLDVLRLDVLRLDVLRLEFGYAARMTSLVSPAAGFSRIK
jgi:hypothetical protein